MSDYVVSARKYRPSTFKTVVGQEIITTTLKNSIKNKQLAHAYLFCGPRGVGKTTCARIFAKTINCFHPTTDYEPCNQCESCINFNKNALFNIHELDAASNNSVDSIRELIQQVRIPPQLGKYSVFIIDEVHMLSKDAFNAFLKTLEEPPAHAIFIMATTEKHKIIPTILSRCQVFDFKRIQINDIVGHLEYIAQQENIEYEKEALLVIAQKADGSMRDALSIFDQMVSFCENHVSYEKVIKNLNVLDYDYYFRLTNMFLHGNTSDALLTFNEILLNGFDPQYFISGLAEHIRNLMLCKDEKTIALLEVSENIAQRYAHQANNCSISFLFQALNIINETDIQYKTSYNKRFLVELMLYRLCYIQTTTLNNSVSSSSQIAEETSQTKKTDPTNSNTEKTTLQANEPYVQQSKHSSAVNEPTSQKQNKSSASLASGFSIKISEKETQKKQTDNTLATEEDEDKPFNIEDAMKVWHSYLQRNETDVRIKTFYTTNTDFATWNDTTLQLKVLNKSQEQEIFKIHDELLSYLKKTLHNKNIKIEIAYSKQEIKNDMPYTDKEKYEYFEKQYPLLKDIKTQLDLDFI
ncbi:MAG: DNA polymerase III subunit gamma/tau [Bacteroidales bacterium]|nr:DNA polymerase III subunit gamma/tau [Bacteroidales bacterium]